MKESFINKTLRWIYNLTIHSYVLAIKVASLFNEKAKSWLYGRKNILPQLKENFDRFYFVNENSKLIWIHCASLGEFEQGRTIIETIKKELPKIKILLTFFSPSGYNYKKEYQLADYVYYLPADTLKNVKKFVEYIKPSMAIFVKYEFWFNYLNELNINKIPVYIASAHFRPDQMFFKWYGGWFRTHLRNINQIFVQDESSIELLRLIDVNNAVVAGDTRYDRVMEQATINIDITLIEQFKGDCKLIVAGSTWVQEEEIINNAINLLPDNYKFIIAPHDVSNSRILQILSKFNEAVVYSNADKLVNLRSKSILIIDSIGLLSKIYKYADIAFIGGGFGCGIHNILEAAAYGVPCVFGPKYTKFVEAINLINLELAFTVNNHNEFVNVVKNISKIEAFNPIKCRILSYMQQNVGATKIIMEKIKEDIN